MNLKREAIALAIRYLAENTSIVRKPDSFETFLNTMFGFETYDQQLARKIENDLDRAKDAAKQKIVDHKFKKITQNI